MLPLVMIAAEVPVADAPVAVPVALRATVEETPAELVVAARTVLRPVGVAAPVSMAAPVGVAAPVVAGAPMAPAVEAPSI